MARTDQHPVTAASAPPGTEAVLLAAVGGPSAVNDMILGQEAAGGRALLQSSLIPKDRGYSRDGIPVDDAWLALGFRFGEDVDDLFQECTLPEGWARKAGSSDPRGSYIVDERGIERVTVFYKAAYYDRKANAYLVNVGYNVATHLIYGDEDPAIPQVDVLTEGERADAIDQLRRYLGKAERHPDIYGDRATRARAGLAILGVPDAEPIAGDGF